MQILDNLKSQLNTRSGRAGKGWSGWNWLG
jgi:hypothetical protein